MFRGGEFTLGVLESSCLHSWGLLYTCHFSLWGGTSLCMCERQEAIIKESYRAATHAHIQYIHTHSHDNSHTSQKKATFVLGFYFEEL